MGIMTDFVIADPSDAERVCDSSPSAPDFEWFETKGVLEHQVAALRAAALGISFDPMARLPESLANGLYIASEEGPAIYQVPTDLVERLAALDADGLKVVAERWATATNEINREGALYVVPGLAALCRRAREQGKAVLLSVAL